MNQFLSLILTFLLLLGWATNVDAKRKNIGSLYAADFPTHRNADSEPDFSLEGEIGIISASGNSDTTSLSGNLVADHEMLNWSNRYTIESNYTRTRSDSQERSVTSAQRFNLSLEADYKLLDPDKRVFLFADYEDNRFDGFDKQGSVAAGWARIKLQSESTSFRYSIGPGYNYAKPIDEEDEDTSGVIIRGTAEFIYQWSSGARLRQLLTTAAGKVLTQSRSETSLSTKVIDDLSMQLSFIVAHNSSPGTDIAAVDTRTSVSLVYQFF
ncbi:DUF481 domain-containing protein [Alteromonas sp. 5E99-2]|uniref:DUF481 domain-containing protein n=1 Tax=Alteromonas sp. 5E99-2 TaxID=2817683 RepID=UPI001A995581|nr:DUF481 domain-containing protein [Alteromonas sp. 5E99-2]MBO1256449.1 DUF481 domain-containing protein [Alteromonas sp. 5E99-2]